MARLCLFYKIVNGLVAVPIPEYTHPTLTLLACDASALGSNKVN